MTSSPGLVSEFSEHGFVILKKVLPEEVLARLRTTTEDVIALAERNNRDVFTNFYLPHRPDQGVLYDLYQRFPEFVALARLPTVVDALRQIYAQNFFLYENSLVYKPKGRPNAVPWHQDFMSRRGEPPKVIAWMALDDVHESNGCMYVIPGSHARGYLPWHRSRGETHHTRVVPEYVDESKAVPVEMNAGDVLLFHACLLHSSREVHSHEPRRAYRVAYQSFDRSAVPRGSPIVISLADPSELNRSHDYEPTRLKWLVHRLGKRLVDW